MECKQSPKCIKPISFIHCILRYLYKNTSCFDMWSVNSPQRRIISIPFITVNHIHKLLIGTISQLSCPCDQAILENQSAWQWKCYWSHGERGPRPKQPSGKLRIFTVQTHNQMKRFPLQNIEHRADSRLACSPWQTSLQSNAFSH